MLFNNNLRDLYDSVQTYRILDRVFQRLSEYNLTNVRFQVLTAASMKLRIFWDVLPCS